MTNKSDLEAAIQLLTANVLEMRTELLAIKALLNQLVEQQRAISQREEQREETITTSTGVEWTQRAMQFFESLPDDNRLDFDKLAELAEHIARRESPRKEIDVYHVGQAYDRLRQEQAYERMLEGTARSGATGTAPSARHGEIGMEREE